MRVDTPPPEEDALSDEVAGSMEDIEIIEIDDLDDIEEYSSDGGGQDDFDEAKLTFYSHSAPAFCCAYEKSMQYVVTGGQDDKGYVWNPETGEMILECKGYKDSVFCVGFSRDSKYVAAADMSGFIQVWDIANKSVSWSFDLMDDLKFMEWHENSNILFGGAADGNCWLWRVPSGETKTFQSFNSSCSCGHIMHDGVRSIVGYEDGSLRFFDLKTTQVVQSVTGPLAHKDPVLSIDCHQDNNLVISGSSDGTANLIKSREGRVLYTLRCEPEDIEHRSVESVGFFATHPLIATGTICGSLAIWDIPTQVRRLQCEQEAGITKLICDPSGPMVFTGGTDGIIRLIDGRTGQLEGKWGGHTAAVLDFALSSDRKKILTCSDDYSCKIFEISR